MNSLDAMEGKSLDEVIDLAVKVAKDHVLSHVKGAARSRGQKTSAPIPRYYDRISPYDWFKLLAPGAPPSAIIAARFLVAAADWLRLRKRECSQSDIEITFLVAYMAHGLLALRSDVSSQKALEVHERLRTAGRKGAGRTNKEYIRKQPAYQKAIDQLRNDNEDINYTAAAEEVGRSLGVSGRTVRKYTVNKKPKKRVGPGRKHK